MAYGFGQRVVERDPDDVIRAARALAGQEGLRTGPVHRASGFLRELVLPLSGPGYAGRLWVWGLAPGLSLAYLGLEDRSVAARAPVGRTISRRSLDRTADGLLRSLGALDVPLETAELRAAA